MTNAIDVAVQCTNVSRTFGSGRRAVVAVHSATAAVPGGSSVAITGPSGSGKSTLLHMLAGLERPTTGIVEWPALNGNPAERTGLVGVVFQAPSLLPPLDVLENVTLPLLLAGTNGDAARERAKRALSIVGLDSLASRLPEELSGGQAQRVAVARVLAQGPPLILADEPTGQLDSQHGDQVVDALLEVSQTLGAALVVATHDPHIASRLSTQWVIDDGYLQVTEEVSTWS